MVDEYIGVKIAFVGFLIAVVGLGIVWFDMRVLGRLIVIIGVTVGFIGLGKSWYSKFNDKKHVTTHPIDQHRRRN